MGILIPPSLGFIIIGILTQISIGKLFIAGIIPGILMVIFYVTLIFIMCRFNPELAPAGPKTTMKEKAKSLSLTWPVLALFLLIIGGMYAGVFPRQKPAPLELLGLWLSPSSRDSSPAAALSSVYWIALR